MTHNNEKAPEQGGEKELTPMAAHPPQTTTVMKSKEDIYQIIESAVGGLRAQAIMKDLFDEIISASQNNQGEGNCKCDNEIKTGQTSAMCCNICGLPDDENWKVPSRLPGTTAHPSAVQAEALREIEKAFRRAYSLGHQGGGLEMGYFENECWATYKHDFLPALSAPQDEGWVEIAQGGDMPEEDEDCLVWTELAKKGQASTFKNKKFYRYSNAVESDRMALYYFPDVTHWRKLPSPPTI